MHRDRVRVGDLVTATSTSGWSVSGVVLAWARGPGGPCIAIERRTAPPLWFTAASIRILHSRRVARR